ncbi:MAG: outer membrane lipoprotein-sorting protein [Candidatus Sulfobium sp.]
MRKLIVGIAVVLLLSQSVFAMTANEVMEKYQAAFLYPGKDFKARVLMKLISEGGQERVREMTMIRKNFGPPGGEQKYFIYFFRPADVRGMTFMVYKHPGRDADRWLFVPALNMVRRIAARDKYSSFVGSDFTYEDVSGRDLAEDTHKMVKEEKYKAKDCYVIKSTPRAGDMQYSYRLLWIDKADFLPLKEEYYDQRGDLYKIFTADEVKDVKGVPTVMKRTMKNLKSHHMTQVTYLDADYNVGISDSLFSERYLKQPPRRWIK